MKPEQERLVTVLKDTISLLCKNSLSYDKTVVIQGLICVTVDKEDVVVVQVNDSLGEDAAYDPCVACGHAKATRPPPEPATPSDRRKRPRSPDGRNSEEHSPSKTPRSGKSPAGDQGRDDDHPADTSPDDSRDLPFGVRIKKEEAEEDDDEDLIMIDAEIKGENYSVSGDYSDNDSSFNLPGTSATDTPYITGFMDNSQIAGITAAPSSSGSQGQPMQGTSWAGQQGDMAAQGSSQGSSVGICKHAHTRTSLPQWYLATGGLNLLICWQL